MSNLPDQNSTTRSTDTVNDNIPLRKLRMEDFLDDTNNKDNNKQNKHNNKHNDINKNQEDFGHKRRIKP
jgi:hypothetical protein